MGKRRSDIGHLSKEEYEALESRGGGGGDESGGGGSRVASKAVLSGRRIIRASRCVV